MHMLLRAAVLWGLLSLAGCMAATVNVFPMKEGVSLPFKEQDITLNCEQNFPQQDEADRLPFTVKLIRFNDGIQVKYVALSTTGEEGFGPFSMHQVKDGLYLAVTPVEDMSGQMISVVQVQGTSLKLYWNNTDTLETIADQHGATVLSNYVVFGTEEALRQVATELAQSDLSKLSLRYDCTVLAS